MKELASFYESPFYGIRAGRNKIVEFFSVCVSMSKKAAADGVPLDELVGKLETAVADLNNCLLETNIKLVERAGDTMTVEAITEKFLAEIKQFDRKVLYHFDKDSVGYHDFFPQGKSAYYYVTKANIEMHFDTLIKACTKHSDKLGTEPAEVWQSLFNDYLRARSEQQEQKGSTESTRSGWDEKLKLVNDLAFELLLTTAALYPNQPDKAKMFFDESILGTRKRKKSDAPEIP